MTPYNKNVVYCLCKLFSICILDNKPDSSQGVQLLLQNVAELAPIAEPLRLTVSRPVTAQPQPVIPLQTVASRPVTAADHTSYYLQVAPCPQSAVIVCAWS